MLKNNSNKIKKIVVVTGTRSEYGILKPLLEKIDGAKNFDLKLMVTGMHLLKKYGLTVNEIKKDGFKINVKIPMYSNKGNDVCYHGKALAKGVGGFTVALNKTKPDMVIMLGDRLESLAAVLAATTLNIPIAHIHGGDKTDSGHIDESIRHSISRFANIHFTPTKGTASRLSKMGEEYWRIFKVGSLGLDTAINEPLVKKNILFKQLNLDPKQKLIVCIFHPVHPEAPLMGEQMREIVKSLKKLKVQTAIIYPNNDSGSQDIIKEISQIKKLPFINIFSNIQHKEYINLLRNADVLIGNSSSGILEASSIKLPVVNIGSRNVGREHGDNVIFVEVEKEKIIKAIKKSMEDKKFINKVKQGKNPYGDGKTSERIIKNLNNIKIDKKLLHKKITY